MPSIGFDAAAAAAAFAHQRISLPQPIFSEAALRSCGEVIEMPPTFKRLDTPTGLAVINEYLIDHSYISGVQPSKADAIVYATLGQRRDASLSSYPHLARWYRHISSFSAAERDQWTGDAEGLVEVEPETKEDAFDADDLFESDDEELDADAYRRQQERAEAALREKEKRDAAKAAQGKATVAKSSVVFDVKPWEAETDLQVLESKIRQLQIDGVTWGAAKLVPIGYGVRKLQIMATIIDDLVPSTDIITEEIEGIEDYVQSVDIAAFNKI